MKTCIPVILASSTAFSSRPLAKKIPLLRRLPFLLLLPLHYRALSPHTPADQRPPYLLDPCAKVIQAGPVGETRAILFACSAAETICSVVVCCGLSCYGLCLSSLLTVWLCWRGCIWALILSLLLSLSCFFFMLSDCLPVFKIITLPWLWLIR